MNISFYHIQNVIKAYGRRVGRKGSLRPNAGLTTPVQDLISISPEAKRHQITETISSQILSKATGQSQEGQTEQDQIHEFVQKLNSELKGLTGDDSDSNLTFRVIDEGNEEIEKTISPDDIENLKERIYSMLDSNSE
ncbi:MAG TPA: hypothetical protein EYP57_05660 [Thermodesulfobacteriaceae bacterium]|nr:hypothetical protein [Thermodesulfobacteriaceae bacterium]